MKVKLLRNKTRNAIILLSMTLLIGCTSIGNDSVPVHVKNHTLAAEPILFEFNNHEYIQFQFSTYKGGVVHNPDCHCFNQNNNGSK